MNIDKRFDLGNLDSHFQEKIQNNTIAIVGGGMSLDYCENDIKKMIDLNAVFFLTDVVAFAFLKRFKLPSENVLIFSVESRPHDYLAFLKNRQIAMYIHARFQNLSLNSVNQVYHFDLKTPNQSQSDVLCLPSAGTVTSAAIAYALHLSAQIGQQSVITLMGVDLVYADNQIYSRYARRHYRYSGRFKNAETVEYLATLQKAAYLRMKQGYHVKTSEEFQSSKKNLELLVTNSLKENIIMADFSPFGIEHPNIKKLLPASVENL